VISPGTLFWGVVFSSIGVGLFMYGRAQRSVVPLIVGVALLVYPYFMPNVLSLVLVGIALSVIPYFFRQ
jgi:hypothetical protein